MARLRLVTESKQEACGAPVSNSGAAAGDDMHRHACRVRRWSSFEAFDGPSDPGSMPVFATRRATYPRIALSIGSAVTG
jgi:hypothetical protein